jgi:hypothetical protein
MIHSSQGNEVTRKEVTEIPPNQRTSNVYGLTPKQLRAAAAYSKDVPTEEHQNSDGTLNNKGLMYQLCNAWNPNKEKIAAHKPGIEPDQLRPEPIKDEQRLGEIQQAIRKECPRESQDWVKATMGYIKERYVGFNTIAEKLNMSIVDYCINFAKQVFREKEKYWISRGTLTIKLLGGMNPDYGNFTYEDWLKYHQEMFNEHYTPERIDAQRKKVLEKYPNETDERRIMTLAEKRACNAANTAARRAVKALREAQNLPSLRLTSY